MDFQKRAEVGIAKRQDKRKSKNWETLNPVPGMW